MNVAIRTYGDTDNPDHLPASWPFDVRELGEGTTPPTDPGNWLVMTIEDYNAYVAANQSLYDAWWAAKEEARIVAEAMQQAAAEAASKPREVLFDTHDFSDPSDWDGRTTGDPVLPQLKLVYPDAFYDDVKYEVRRPDGTILAKLAGVTSFTNAMGITEYRLNERALILDGTTIVGRVPRRWVDSDGDDLCVYDQTEKKWRFLPTETLTISSRWIIDPYAGTYIIIDQVTNVGEPTALIQPNSALRFRMMVGAGTAVGAEFTYQTVDKLIRNCNSPTSQRHHRSGTVLQEYIYDYTKTVPWKIDSVFAMTLEIDLIDHLPILGSVEAYATFVGREYGVRQV